MQIPFSSKQQRLLASLLPFVDVILYLLSLLVKRHVEVAWNKTALMLHLCLPLSKLVNISTVFCAWYLKITFFGDVTVPFAESRLMLYATVLDNVLLHWKTHFPCKHIEKIIDATDKFLCAKQNSDSKKDIFFLWNQTEIDEVGKIMTANNCEVHQ